jgi:Protein of unknown function (DUF1592)/Protein of unknown function (DUF1588)/Protein of unknown function (DUF1595)/Protein of unknown function (DUF1585)/Protein of unknown function (DUF1587)
MIRKALIFVATMQLLSGTASCTGYFGGTGAGANAGGPNGGAPGAPGTPGTPGGPVNPTTPYTPDMPLPEGPLVPTEATARRLTNDEMSNTVKDALGVDIKGLSFIENDRGSTGYDKAVVTRSLAFGDSKGLLETFEEVAFNRMDPKKVAGCELVGAAAEGCVSAYLKGAAWKLFRRPLTDAEVNQYLAVFRNTNMATPDAPNAFRTMIGTMLVSPYFVYRTEIGSGTAPVTATTSVLMSPFEIAAALSYLLWSTIPDDTLYQAAAGGQLSTPAQVEAQALRMLEDARAASFSDAFSKGFLGLVPAAQAAKNPMKFPNFTAAVAQRAQLEAMLQVRDVVLSKQGTFEQLLTSDAAYVSKSTASIYGLDPAMFGDAPSKTTLDKTVRQGLLMHPGYLTSRSYADKTSPVHLGQHIAGTILCIQFGQPPPNAAEVDKALPLPPNPTNRDKYNARIQNANCAGCHKRMEPLGLAFEGFDVSGAKLPTAVDTSGNVFGTDKDDGPFQGPIDLTEKLAKSAQAQNCFTSQFFRFAYGRTEGAGDFPVLERLGNAFYKDQQGNVSRLVASLLTHPAFVTRRADP